METFVIESNEVRLWEIRVILLEIQKLFFPDAMYFDEPMLNFDFFEIDIPFAKFYIGIRKLIPFQEPRFILFGKLVTRHRYENVVAVYVDNSTPDSYLVSILQTENKNDENEIKKMFFPTHK